MQHALFDNHMEVEEMQLEDLLNRVKQFGRYQRYICLLLCIVSLPNGFQALANVFIMNIPKHR